MQTEGKTKPFLRIFVGLVLSFSSSAYAGLVLPDVPDPTDTTSDITYDFFFSGNDITQVDAYS